ncbi:MAG: regulatory protein RecX [Clostridia bacterium]|nr:regulatory protein RecX [Clostridia bacterium]
MLCDAAMNDEKATRYRVVSLRASEDGERIYLRVKGEASSGDAQAQTYTLRVEEYAALHLKLTARSLLTQEEVERIGEAAVASGAYSRGLHILGYGANSARTLHHKLTEKGFDPEVATRAVEALSEKGYLREERDACRVAKQIMRRGRGKRRILQELRARGYGDEALRAAAQSLTEEDFGALCVEVLRRKSPCPPSESDERRKTVAYLLRCGFEMSDIRAAMTVVWSVRGGKCT